jgi:hypothetical protein
MGEAHLEMKKKKQSCKWCHISVFRAEYTQSKCRNSFPGRFNTSSFSSSSERYFVTDLFSPSWSSWNILNNKTLKVLNEGDIKITKSNLREIFFASLKFHESEIDLKKRKTYF